MALFVRKNCDVREFRSSIPDGMIVAEGFVGFSGVGYCGAGRCSCDEIFEEIEGEDIHDVKKPLVDE